MRFYCSLAGLEGNWVEVDSVWTRRQLRDLADTDGAGLIEYLQTKLQDCHIERIGEDPITDPGEITEEAMDDMDLRVVSFLGSVLLQAAVELRSLGNLSGLRSSDSPDEAKAKKA